MKKNVDRKRFAIVKLLQTQFLSITVIHILNESHGIAPTSFKLDS